MNYYLRVSSVEPQIIYVTRSTKHPSNGNRNCLILGDWEKKLAQRIYLRICFTLILKSNLHHYSVKLRYFEELSDIGKWHQDPFETWLHKLERPCLLLGNHQIQEQAQNASYFQLVFWPLLNRLFRHQLKYKIGRTLSSFSRVGN